jgi:hypothetical protein
LKEGATVFAVDNREKELSELSDKLGLDADQKSRLITVVGDFSSDETGLIAKAAVEAALSGKTLNHVVTAIGCSSPAPAGTGVTAADALKRTKETYETVFFPNLNATTLFLELVRDVEGASFTVAGGPFTHHCPTPELFNVSLMGATSNRKLLPSSIISCVCFLSLVVPPSTHSLTLRFIRPNSKII